MEEQQRSAIDEVDEMTPRSSDDDGKEAPLLNSVAAQVK